MSYLALYRKYRPKTFDEVAGQDNVIKILSNSIKNDHISHAYLFSGPRGTGKTSIAQLIAKVINCENKKGVLTCEKCSSCISFNEKNNPDIIEIDAASNNGVDEIRALREKATLMPSISQYKVYIIDEVHMLSTGAFNALLKTLEEPPKHVIFILATTEFYKMPDTIVSRCQCFDFEKIDVKNIEKKLHEIIKKEKITIDDEVVALIAKYSDGGLRNAISTLDKLVCCMDKITVEDFYQMNGLVSESDNLDIFNYLKTKDYSLLFSKIDDLISKGKNIIILAEELMNCFKNNLINNVTNNLISLDKNYLFMGIDILNETITNMKNSSYPKTIFEVGMLKILSLNNDSDLSKGQKQPNQEQEISFEEQKKAPEIKGELKQEKNEKALELAKLIEKNRKIRINNTFATADKKILSDLKIRWINFSEYLSNKNYTSIVSYLMDGNLRVAGDENIIVSVAYSGILENALINIKKIEELLKLVMNKDYKIAFILDSEWDELKKQYIESKNSGKEYLYIEEIPIDYDALKEELKDNSNSEIVDEAISLFGKDIVEIK